jgi:ABC-type sugar transport system ATPase subunit
MPQELTILPGLSVAENIVVGAEPSQGPFLWPARRNAAARNVLERFGLRLPLAADAATLTAPQQRLVMFAHALHKGARVLILDEPTAALSDSDAEVITDAVQNLRREGISVIYVSHRFHEILQLCDAVTVIRDGTSVGTIPRAELDLAQLVTAVVGKGALLDSRPRSGRVGDPILEVADLAGRELRGVSLTLRAGEILGVAGLPGSGVSELLEILGGAQRQRQGTMRVRDRTVSFGSPADALQKGIAYLPAERSRSSLLGLTVRFNVVVSSLGRVARAGMVTVGIERKAVGGVLKGVGIVGKVDQSLGSLSGGNRQKALMARCLKADAAVLVLDDPTVGVDVRARHDLHDLLRGLADQGRAVIVSASEIEELAAIADRVVVLKRGRLTNELKGAELTPDAVVAAATHGPASAA